MLPAQQKDLFGHQNQGENYDRFRPVYPKEFFEIILKHLTNRSNYIDIACGTGQLLFDLCGQFSQSYGIDISPKQIEVAQQKITAKGLENSVKVSVSDAHKVIEKNENLKNEFDLITIGQALHWFDTQAFFSEVKENLARKHTGIFAVTGYFCRGLNFLDAEGNIAESGDAIYDEYYAAVKDYFDCDRENLSLSYAGYDFTKHFVELEKKELITSTPCTPFEMTKYMKTYSAYNTLLEKKKGDASFVDPIIKFEKDLAARISTHSKQPNQFPIALKTSYFLRIFKAL